MKSVIFFLTGLMLVTASGCVSVNKLSRHDFDSGYYKLEKEGSDPLRVYADVTGDSMVVYPVLIEDKKELPDINYPTRVNITSIKTGDHYYKSCFVQNSVDVDLTTVLFKLRPPVKNVPVQLSYSLNAAVYVGLRKDFYKINTEKSPLKEESSSIRQIGFDAGLFAGIGITPINPSVTEAKEILEYDGMVLQKGLAAFVTFNRMSIGLTLGFDNLLLDDNKKIWIYNQKPYIGLIIGILNF